ncbi:MAG: FkbM family methyltransferase [Pseudomonadota bacterium]
MTAEALPVYVINRAADEDRIAGFAAAADALGVGFTRIEALDGHDPDAPLFLYRDLLRDGFWGEDRIKPGALACAVGHMHAWRRMLAEGAEAALILEDDARLIADPAGLAAAAKRYEDADLVFANPRMIAWRSVGAAKSDAALIPVAKAASRMAAKGARPGADDMAAGPGADAYLVTRKGAEALLGLMDAVGLIAGIDWIMAAAAGARGLGSAESDFLDGAITGAPTISAYIAREAVTEDGGGPSAIRHRETIPLAALREGLSLNREGGAVAPLDLREDPVSDAFRGGRFYEEPALAMMARWMPRGGVFADVGAHVGNHTLFMLRHGGAGRAIPFEHNRFAIEAFRAVIDANGLTERVDDAHLGFGLAEEAGKREAKGGKRNPFVNRLKRGFDEQERVRPGDALLRESEVDMIKIDVNGEEREVLKGLRKTLKRKRPLLVVDMTRERSLKALPLIERLGYAAAERAEWNEAGARRSVVLYRPGHVPGP